LTNICIAVDAMGGDHGPNVVIPATLQVLSENTDLRLILVGKQPLIEAELAATEITRDNARLLIKNASQVVDMDELPSYALRGKKDSSMRIALNLMQEGVAQACVSAGNTGALMATARFVLKMLPGVERPAIMFPLPSMQRSVYVLDLGANVECQAVHLFQFAVMGSVSIEAIQNIPSPRVGLLNVGSEAIKGTEQVKKASQLLAATQGINYVGYVEGDDIYKGTVDLIVCDGFVGNVALKASEGLAAMMLYYAKQEFTKNWYAKLLSIFAKPVLKSLFERFNTNHYNGGSLLGLRGVVLKSHGNASINAFATAIRVAIKEVEQNVPEKIRQSVLTKLEDCEFA